MTEESVVDRPVTGLRGFPFLLSAGKEEEATGTVTPTFAVLLWLDGVGMWRCSFDLDFLEEQIFIKNKILRTDKLHFQTSEDLAKTTMSCCEIFFV